MNKCEREEIFNSKGLEFHIERDFIVEEECSFEFNECVRRWDTLKSVSCI